MERLPLVIISLGGASTFMMALFSTWAMTHGGTLTSVDFNRFYEGWFEVAFYITTLLLYPWAFWKLVKKCL